jgi:nucleoside-diphosphate-sugar epimerase
MNILVTGGTGFLGKRLVSQLLKERHNVSVFVRHAQDEFPKNVRIFTGDVRNAHELGPAIQGADIVCHLAICLNESDPNMWDINVNGTKNVVNLCKKHKVKQLVYMSSSGVLGETKEPSKEDFHYNPKTRYEKSKMESEKMIISSGVPYTIVRTTIIIGPNMVWQKILGAAKKGFPIIGSGKNFFHLVYVDDVVRMLCLSIKNKNAKNNIFHIASKDVQTYDEVYSIMCDALKCKKTEKHIPIWLAFTMSRLHTMKRKLQGKQPSLTMMRSSIERLVRNRNMSIEKAEKVLGFVPRYSTKDAIYETVKYLKIAQMGYSDYDLSELHKIKHGKEIKYNAK